MQFINNVPIRILYMQVPKELCQSSIIGLNFSKTPVLRQIVVKYSIYISEVAVEGIQASLDAPHYYLVLEKRDSKRLTVSTRMIFVKSCSEASVNCKCYEAHHINIRASIWTICYHTAWLRLYMCGVLFQQNKTFFNFTHFISFCLLSPVTHYIQAPWVHRSDTRHSSQPAPTSCL